MKTRALLAAAAVATALAPATANATAQGIGAMQNWKGVDKCAFQAHQAFPDYTAEANAKRDAAMKACISGGFLPPRNLQSAPPQK